MRKNGTNIPEIIEVICKLIFTNTKNKVVFHQTTKIPLPSDPIEDVSLHFPPSRAKLQDFFQVHESNKRNVEIHLVFALPGAIEAALHETMEILSHKTLFD